MGEGLEVGGELLGLGDAVGGEGRVRGDTRGGIVGGAVGTRVGVDGPVEAEAVASYIYGC